MAALTSHVARLFAAYLVAAHPMHTSVTELGLAADGQSVRVTIRVFADDFSAAAGVDATEAYVRDRFVVTDRVGRRLALRLKEREPQGDALVLRLSARAPAGLAGARVRNALLCERFADQVNILRYSSAGRTGTLLFTPGADTHRLP